MSTVIFFCSLQREAAVSDPSWDHSAEVGGINYMTSTQREFIENWEVESYRQKQV